MEDFTLNVRKAPVTIWFRIIRVRNSVRHYAKREEQLTALKKKMHVCALYAEAITAWNDAYEQRKKILADTARYLILQHTRKSEFTIERDQRWCKTSILG